MKLTRRQLNRATLARQLLLDRSAATVTEAVGALCGLQAQEPMPPFLGLWTRLAGFDRTSLLDALHTRQVVRASLMRGTLHLLTGDDYVEFRPALQPVLTRAMQRLGKRITAVDLDRLVAAARAALDDGPLTFGELRPRLQAQFPDVDERALGYAVRTNLPLVVVPNQDRWGFASDSAFSPGDRWLDRPLRAEAEPDELVRRYLGAFGPASAADVQEWSGLQGAKAVLGRLRPELAVFVDERGRELFDLPSAPRPDADVDAALRLLPDYDSLVLAHADRTRVISDEHRPALVTKNLRVRATVLWDGFVHGTWTLKYTKTKATVEVSVFSALPRRARDALAVEAEGAARFVAGDVKTFDLQIRPI